MIARIEICGGIASGKSTLAAVLSSQAIVANLEDFRANPFWEAFYEDPGGVAFETELTFLLQHYHYIKRPRLGNQLIVCDHSLLLDLAYARVTLRGRHLVIFGEVFSQLWSELGPPGIVIHLRCDTETELGRIKDRGREVEKKINLSYLSALHAALDLVVDEYRATLRMIEIDSAATNFAVVEGDMTAVREKVWEAMRTYNLGELAV